jgi:hypothetical protein
LAERFQCQGQQLKYIENWAIILFWKKIRVRVLRYIHPTSAARK